MLRPFRMGLIAITGISGLLLMEAGIVSTALEVFFYSVYDSDGSAALGTFTRYVKIPFFSES